MSNIDIISKCLNEYNDKFYFCNNEEHIKTWASQFSDPDFVIDEFANISKKTFINKKSEDYFFQNLLTNTKFLNDIVSFDDVSILILQEYGKSQDIYSHRLQNIIYSSIGKLIPINNYTKNKFVYIDDFLFSGSTARHDIMDNIDLFMNKKVIFLFIGLHSSGVHYFQKVLKQNNIPNSFWSFFELNNYNSPLNNSDTYWPTQDCIKEASVSSYVQTFTYPAQ